MKPLEITQDAPRRQARREKYPRKWENTDADFDAVGWTAREDEDLDPTKEQLEALRKIEITRFVEQMAGMAIVIWGHDGYEWWSPPDLLRACLEGDEEFEPSMHQYRIHSFDQLIAMLQEDIFDVERRIARIRRCAP